MIDKRFIVHCVISDLIFNTLWNLQEPFHYFQRDLSTSSNKKPNSKEIYFLSFRLCLLDLVSLCTVIQETIASIAGSFFKQMHVTCDTFSRNELTDRMTN